MHFQLERYQSLQKACPEASIVVVTKYQDTATTQEVIDAGIEHIAEAKVQDAKKKKEQLVGNYRYHLIGHLQSNKAKEAVEIFDMIQSVDSIKLLNKLEQEAKKQEKKMPILLQANLTGESQKYGFHLRDMSQAIQQAKHSAHLDLQGCMCMGKQDDAVVTRMAYMSLVHICQQHHLDICSIGMSHDRQLAYSQGSTMLRIGSMLFDA